MGILHYLLNFVLHLDEHLMTFVSTYGAWTYALLFLIIFCETGIVFIAFLPGDSLLFAAGALAANSDSALNINILFTMLVAASVIGNGVNYFTGKWIGPKVFRSEHSWLFNPAHLTKAHQFYEKFGGKAIVIARFIPIIRTVVPFIAGIGYMTYRHFFIFNLIGALLWMGLLLYGSYSFGNIPVVKAHFSLVIVAIIVLSVFPAFIEVTRRYFAKPAS